MNGDRLAFRRSVSETCDGRPTADCCRTSRHVAVTCDSALLTWQTTAQVLTTELYDGKVADIWSCGVMLYVLLEGSFPFARKGDEDMKGARALQMMFGRIIKADFPMPSDVRSLLLSYQDPDSRDAPQTPVAMTLTHLYCCTQTLCVSWPKNAGLLSAEPFCWESVTARPCFDAICAPTYLYQIMLGICMCRQSLCSKPAPCTCRCRTSARTCCGRC